MSSISINLHDYCSNYVFLHNLTLPGVGEFWA